MSLIDTYKRIKALAENGATQAERDTAADILAKLKAKMGDADIETAESVEISVVLRHCTPVEEACVMHVAKYLDLRAFYAHRPNGRKVLDRTRLVGPEHLAVLAEGLVNRHKAAAKRLADLAMYAYFAGAMPTPREPPRIGKAPADTTTPEERALIRAALGVGRNADTIPRLPG